MLELPKGGWEWISRNARDIGRVADALETIAREATAIRKELQEDQRKDES